MILVLDKSLSQSLSTKIINFILSRRFKRSFHGLIFDTMQGLYAILLLIVSNIFMTFAWYGHLKLQEMKWIDNWPLFGVILFSWCIALFEYCAQVPANRLGFIGNGGPFSLMQLKVVQEVITLTIFIIFSMVFFKGVTFQWNHLAACVCLVLAVYFVFMK